MISHIEVKGLRALRYVSIDLERFLVMVGPNACGKSTLFDAILIVRDILIGGLDAAVFGNMRMNIPARAPSPNDLTWLREGNVIEIAITMELPKVIKDKLENKYKYSRYEVGIRTSGNLGFEHETLWLCNDIKRKEEAPLELFPAPAQPPLHIVHPKKGRSGWTKIVNKVVNSGNDYFKSETSDWNNLFRLGPTKSALANLPEDEQKFPAATWTKRFLMEGVHRLTLNAEKMRMPSPAGSPKDFLPDGSNLPWVVHELEKTNSAVKSSWVQHLSTTLEDLEDIITQEKPEDRSRYIELKYKNGLKAPSWLLSDGTLRMLALTLLAYAPTTPNIVLIEEPENGIHPKAIAAIMESLSSVYDSQILCATHSPVVLTQIRPKNILCFAKTKTGEIDIVRGNNHPKLQEWKSDITLGDLFVGGVLG